LLVLLSLCFANQLPWAVFSLQRWLATESPAACFVFSRTIVAGGIILLPCFCLGVIFPTIMSMVYGAQGPSRFSVVPIYVANTLGAMLGCVFGGVLMLPMLASIWVSGLQLSLFVAALLSLVLAFASISEFGLVKFRNALLALPFV